MVNGSINGKDTGPPKYLYQLNHNGDLTIDTETYLRNKATIIIEFRYRLMKVPIFSNKDLIIPTRYKLRLAFLEANLNMVIKKEDTFVKLAKCEFRLEGWVF